jgi:hypothetical protein
VVFLKDIWNYHVVFLKGIWSNHLMLLRVSGVLTLVFLKFILSFHCGVSEEYLEL